MTADDAVLYRAIADPTRRRILDLLRDHGPLRAGDIAAQFFNMSRIAVSKHVRVLQEARLIRAAKSEDGRERLYDLDPEPLREIQDWLATYEAFWQKRLAILKELVEDGEDDHPRVDDKG